MNILIACEESQRVCTAFRNKGHRAFSCDIIDCSGGHPEWHIKGDVIPLLNGNCTFTTSDTHTHTGRTLGYDNSSPALHLSFKLCYKDVFVKSNSGGKSCLALGTKSKGSRFLYEVCPRRLRKDMRRKSRRIYEQRLSTADAVY